MLANFFDRVTRLALRGYWVTIFLSLAILAAGVLALGDLNLELLPRIEFPQTVVLAQWSDAESNQEFLERVTIPLENGLSAVEGVVNVESTTNPSLAVIIARNEFGLNQERVLEDITSVVEGMDYPEGMDTPEIINFGFSDLPIAITSISSSELSLAELKALVESELQPRLESLALVSQVSVGGGQELPEDLRAADETEEESVAEVVPTPTATAEPTPLPTETPDPAQLPDLLVQGAASMGLTLESAEDITPEIMRQIGALGPQANAILGLLSEDNLRALPPETIAWLPLDFVEGLNPDMREELDTLADAYGGAAALSQLESEAMADDPEAVAAEDLPEVEPVDLPDSWQAAAAQFDQTLETTADVDSEIMSGIASFAPELLADLTPAMWLALDPEAAAVALPAVEDSMDPLLAQQLAAIAAAAAGEDPEPALLPDDLVAMAAASGQTVTNTAQIPPEMLGLIIDFAPPEMLQQISPDILLGFNAEALSLLPPQLVETLSPEMQQTLANIQVHAERHALLSQPAPEEEVVEAEPTPSPTPDPAALPPIMVQIAGAAGLDIAVAQDVTPEMARLFAGLGPQGVQALGLLTPDNLRLLQPEVIALLPPEFLDTLDPALRAELDEIAAEFGGAGQLAIEEAEEAAAQAEGAPPLQGIWLEPDAEGNPSMFTNAADILNNAFMPGAAEFLNVFPSSPNVEDPVEWMSALNPEVIQYLAENEEDFIADLSPVILEMFSPESLTYILEVHADQLAPELQEHLAGIAAGEITAFVPEDSITRTDGNPSLIVSIYKDGDANTVDASHSVFEALDGFAADYPETSYEIGFEQASFIEESISGVAREGILGAVFAVLVILLFLSGRVKGRYRPSWRSTIITGLSIPLSIFIAFFLMRWVPATFGVWMTGVAENSDSVIINFISRLFPENITLNIMTLSGLTVAVGRVVDDSIVVLENIYRYIQQGDDPRHAIIEGTREVTVAIFSSTVTTMAVFLPLGLIGGLIGAFFLPFGLTVTYALAGSFIVAITTVPALAFAFIRKEHLPEGGETWMQRTYTPILEYALHHRGLTMVAASLLFAGSLLLLNQLPQSFIPSLGEATVNVSVDLPGSVQMVETNDLMLEFEEAIADVEGIETVQAEVGGSGGFESFFGGGVGQNQANATISIADQDMLNSVTQAVRDEAEAVFGEEYVSVSGAAQAGFGGFALILVGESTDQLAAFAPDVIEALESVDSDGDGQPDIVNVTSSVDSAGGSSDAILRIDGRPAISFGGEMETRSTLGATEDAKAAVAAIPGLPADVEVTEGFDSQQQTEGFAGMQVAIGYAIILVYLIMALTFRSPIHPFTILFSLPFALVGAAIALYVSNSVLGISAMIGLMMLVGVVVTNAIVLLELVQQLRARGYSAYDALVEGGRTRLRPIWMTALTAILALIPLAVSGESGAVIASELARAVMGGLIVSTFLTLLVIPVVYSLFEDMTVALRGVLRRAT